MNKRDTLLIVDDMEINRAILHGLFEREYNLLEAENGDQALMLLEQYHCVIAVVLLDVMMPVRNGYQVLTAMAERNLLTEVPVVVITAEGSAENEVRAFDLGASDIIMKPFEPYVVKRRVQNIVELNRHKQHLEELVEEQSISLRESNEILVDALSSIIEYRNLESGQHILRIRTFSKILLEDVARSYQEYSLDERKIGIIASAASMHDIGKIAIPDAVLNKPGLLTVEEFEIMKTHSIKGCDILAGLDRMSDKEYLQYAYNICRYHHERWDGRGYPDGLRGDNIPLCAQVVSIADAYDALTTDRVYKKAFPHEQAFTMILNGECGVFSPKLLECFKNVRIEFSTLSREYADGRSPKSDHVLPELPKLIHHDDTLDTLQLGQTKYFALLRYADSTVMEVDLNTGIYHLVYAPNSDFDLLRTGAQFEESLRNFVAGSVHPKDRGGVLELLGEYMQSFFEDGIMKRVQKYRVFSHDSGTYLWCCATILRIDIRDPRQRKVMIVWHTLESEAGHPSSSGDMPTDSSLIRSVLGRIQKCRNDQYFTLVHANGSVTALLGYTDAEMQARFQNRYISLICPADRDEVLLQTKQQLSCGSTVELEYRLTAKDGHSVWVLDKSQCVTEEDGVEYLYRLLVDVTQSKKAQEDLRLTLERHKIITGQTNDIIFEWDMITDQLTFSSNWEKKFGYIPIQESASKKIPLVSHLYPEDIPKFMSVLKNMCAGVSYAETELRIAKADGRYLWCKARASAQYNAAGNPIKAVGVLLDIDGEKRAAQVLQDRAERDSLTKLHNKAAGRREINLFLEQRIPSDRAAMLIIDVDNFKLVNDRFGHMFGDAVLTEIASEIRKLFRNADVVSRIGGDEFMIFMRRISNNDLVEDRASRAVTAFQNLSRNHLEDCSLSCSIGVAFCPEDGLSFQDLFQKADRALYWAKAQGKNQYSLYDQSTMDKSFGRSQEPLSVISTRIDSDDTASATAEGLIQRAFRLLYELPDVEDAVNAILALVGRQFDVSRAYIFENSTDSLSCCNTFEWCNEGVSTALDQLQSIPYSALGGSYLDNFNETGIFYCPDVSQLSTEQYTIIEPQRIRSMLQCAIRDNGKFVGFVGFDDCTMRRMWTQEQINVLTSISELLSASLLKKRAQDRALEAARDMRMVLDNQNSWIYVIDPDTYALQYINAKTHAITPKAQLGTTCYETFMGRSTPCACCPAQNIRFAINCTQEIYNPILNVWSMADASLIRWGNMDACLLTCHDITPYKEQASQRE